MLTFSLANCNKNIWMTVLCFIDINVPKISCFLLFIKIHRTKTMANGTL